MSILRDGRRTGPRGTPSALNTCFGWVLFGKINGRSDVVDVANHTMEQLVYRDETTRRSYAAVLTAGKNEDLRCTGRRKGRVVEDQPQVSRREYIPEECRIRQREFGKSRISQNARKDGLTPRRRWRSTWETKGFRPAGCWRQNAIN